MRALPESLGPSPSVCASPFWSVISRRLFSLSFSLAFPVPLFNSLTLVSDSDTLSTPFYRVLPQEGFTPLHHAAERGQRDCLEALLDAGADAGARTRVRSFLPAPSADI